MSVSFANPAAGPIGYQAMFICGGIGDAIWADKAAAEAHLSAHGATCASCAAGAVGSCPCGCLAGRVSQRWDEVNMSNRNARAVLDLLSAVESRISGEELCGDCPADVFAAAVAAAGDLASAADATLATTVHSRPGAATMVDCGRDADYFTGRLAQLAELAQRATATGPDAVISWA